jgi:hypothetical protein
VLPLALLLLSLDPHVARQRPIGSWVTVEGFVTVPSGLFSSFLGDNGFVLGDGITGIYIATDAKTYRSLGSAVEAKGMLADNGHGMLVLRASTIRADRGRKLVKPWKHESDKLDEFYEGKLVETEGVVTRFVPDRPYGDKLFLKRGADELQVFLPVGVRPADEMLKPGQAIRVVGFCAQYDRVYELVPRSAKDFRLSR